MLFWLTEDALETLLITALAASYGQILHLAISILCLSHTNLYCNWHYFSWCNVSYSIPRLPGFNVKSVKKIFYLFQEFHCHGLGNASIKVKLPWLQICQFICSDIRAITPGGCFYLTHSAYPCARWELKHCSKTLFKNVDMRRFA